MNTNQLSMKDTKPRKQPELKFKMESVGVRPEDDDDLHLCPARTRPFWPKKIIPWWTPSFPNEKPPYSYSTLIAYAILSSKDGRLTLNDIYLWISKTYAYFEAGKGGWQNSIRHNLSLNKKWFCKVDRRPTQANPGKGCYWTLIAGTEHIFIENLTEESSHNRKHNDVGLTAELSIGKRRGACFYNDYVPPSVSHLELQKTYLDTPPQTPTTPTTFKTVKMVRKPEPVSFSEDSDNDSGVDVSTKYIHKPSLRKRARTAPSSSNTIIQQDTSAKFQSTDHNEMNQWLVEQSIINPSFMDYQNALLSPSLMPDFQQQQQYTYPYISPLLNNNNEKSTTTTTTNKFPITIHLNNQGAQSYHQQQADYNNTVNNHFMLLNNENNVYSNFNTILPATEDNALQFMSHSMFDSSMQDYFYL